MRESTYLHIKENLHILELDVAKGTVLNRKINVNDKGYLRFRLAGKCVKVHQVIAVKLWGERCVGMTINHINEDKTNNTPKNLELMSHSENSSIRSLRRGGTPTMITIDGVTYSSISEASRVLGVTRDTVRKWAV